MVAHRSHPNLYYQYNLKILTSKNLRFTEWSTKIHLNTRLDASDVFHMFTVSSFDSIIVQVSEKHDLSNRQ